MKFITILEGFTLSIKRRVPEFYQVKKGETLKNISEKFEIDSTKILLDNQISPKQIKEGLILILKK
ncbi:MAG: LysM peptidoglycan-binding domain-containing protein [Clostridia bacterium]|nr:LysM peptidoglycan-binding domain-containing protein [Clostridia bacterium]